MAKLGNEDDRADFAQEERLGLPCWTMILTIFCLCGRIQVSGRVMADFGQTEFGQTDFGQSECFSGMADFGPKPTLAQTDFGQTDFGQTEFDLWLCVFVCVCVCVLCGGFVCLCVAWVMFGAPRNRPSQDRPSRDRPPLDRPKFRSFFPLPPQNSFFSSLSGGLLVEFWWCLKRRVPEMCAFGVLWLSCASPGGFGAARELQTCTFERPSASNTTKRGKKREILGLPPFGPHPSAPTLQTPTRPAPTFGSHPSGPHPSGPHPSGPHSSGPHPFGPTLRAPTLSGLGPPPFEPPLLGSMEPPSPPTHDNSTHTKNLNN